MHGTCDDQAKNNGKQPSATVKSVLSLEHACTPEEIALLTDFLFAPGTEPDSNWTRQPLKFGQSVPYGLEQVTNGPCGVLAALQAHIIRYLLWPDGPTAQDRADRLNNINEALTRKLLTCAIQEILVRAAAPQAEVKYVFASESDWSDFRRLRVFRAKSAKELRSFLKAQLDNVMAQGVLAFLASAILSRGDRVRRDISEWELNKQFISEDSLTQQQAVNLILTGQATPDTFDHDKTKESFGLTGITVRSNCGFLICDTYNDPSMSLTGEFLTNPTFPVWVLKDEDHYIVGFATSIAAEDEDSFDLRVYDQSSQSLQVITVHTRGDHGKLYTGGKFGFVIKKWGMGATVTVRSPPP